MMGDNILGDGCNDFVKNDTEYMRKFRQNVLQYMEKEGITLSQLAELSNLSVDTLKSFLYKDSKDCKLGTAVGLAKAMHMSIDRLVDAGTMNPVVTECLETVDRLPHNEKTFLVWYIRHLGRMYGKEEILLPEYISVMTPQCVSGSLLWCNEWTRLNIEACPPDIRLKCFMGLTIPCFHYMPAYSNGDILLLAQDRLPMNSEHCVIEMNRSIYVARCVKKGDNIYFHSIVNADTIACNTDVNRIIGYVAYVVRAQ